MVTGKKEVHIISGFPDSFILDLAGYKKAGKKKEKKNNYDNVNNLEKKQKQIYLVFHPYHLLKTKNVN